MPYYSIANLPEGRRLAKKGLGISFTNMDNTNEFSEYRLMKNMSDRLSSAIRESPQMWLEAIILGRTKKHLGMIVVYGPRVRTSAIDKAKTAGPFYVFPDSVKGLKPDVVRKEILSHTINNNCVLITKAFMLKYTLQYDCEVNTTTELQTLLATKIGIYHFAFGVNMYSIDLSAIPSNEQNKWLYILQTSWKPMSAIPGKGNKALKLDGASMSSKLWCILDQPGCSRLPTNRGAIGIKGELVPVPCDLLSREQISAQEYWAQTIPLTKNRYAIASVTISFKWLVFDVDKQLTEYIEEHPDDDEVYYIRRFSTVLSQRHIPARDAVRYMFYITQANKHQTPLAMMWNYIYLHWMFGRRQDVIRVVMFGPIKDRTITDWDELSEFMFSIVSVSKLKDRRTLTMMFSKLFWKYMKSISIVSSPYFGISTIFAPGIGPQIDDAENGIVVIGGKACGKSTLFKKLPPHKYIIVDSDDLGRIAAMIPEMEDRQGPGYMDAAKQYYTYTEEEKDELSSVFELMALSIINEIGLSFMDVIGHDPKMDYFMKRFEQLYSDWMKLLNFALFINAAVTAQITEDETNFSNQRRVIYATHTDIEGMQLNGYALLQLNPINDPEIACIVRGRGNPIVQLALTRTYSHMVKGVGTPTSVGVLVSLLCDV